MKYYEQDEPSHILTSLEDLASEVAALSELVAEVAILAPDVVEHCREMDQAKH